MPEYRLSAGAEGTVADIVACSEEHFGALVADRYAALLLQGFRDIAKDPARPGSTPLPQGTALRAYHVRHSRGRVEDPPGRVGQPRHIIVYEIAADGVVDVLGLHHDAMPPDVGVGAVLRRL